MGQVRRGVGRLIADTHPTPIVVPIFHAGMEQILSVGAMVPVACGKQLAIRVGEPLCFEDLKAKHRGGGSKERAGACASSSSASAPIFPKGTQVQEKALHTAIADRIGGALRLLELQHTQAR
jgi:hypothetical protein